MGEEGRESISSPKSESGDWGMRVGKSDVDILVFVLFI